jgi:hypothetical protein
MKDLKLYFEGNDYCSHFFKNYVNHIAVGIEDCDYIISSNLERGNAHVKEIQAQLDKYINYDKKVIAFLISDFNNKLNIPKNVMLFRTSLYKSIKKDNEFVLPYLYEFYTDEFKQIEKTEKPIVGFCGNVKKNSGLRLNSVDKLESDTNIKTNFITRLGFAGDKQEWFPDFKKNILESHFTLSNRGKGNFSIRFYQVLSLGRIPVLINTDMVFPFENEIKWDSIIIRSNTQNGMLSKINHWWKTKNNEELIKIQKQCKTTFETYLSPTGFGNKMYEFLVYHKENPIKIRKKYFDFIKFPHIKYKIKRYTYTIKLKLLNKKTSFSNKPFVF